MSNPKRKVTDLLPTEAILISSYKDLKVLEEFEKVGIVWVNGGEKPTQWKPFPNWEFPDRITLYKGRISRGSANCYIELPATHFIPTESDEVEVSDTNKHLQRVLECFKSDPNASDHKRNYAKTEQYLLELIEKDGSICSGLISAIERHLNK